MVETVHYICYFCFTDLLKSFELIDPAVSSIVNIVTSFFMVKCSTFAILGDWLEALYSVYIYLNWLSIELLAVNVFMVVLVQLSLYLKRLAC